MPRVDERVWDGAETGPTPRVLLGPAEGFPEAGKFFRKEFRMGRGLMQRDPV